MKRTILFLTVIGLSLISAHSIRAFEFKDNPIVEGITNCSPTTLVNVTLSNHPVTDPCDECGTWYVSLWEYDPGSGTYVQLGKAYPFSAGPTYNWTGVDWDFASYPCLVMIWHYIDTGGGGCTAYGCNLTDKIQTYCPGSVGNWTKYDFYPD